MKTFLSSLALAITLATPIAAVAAVPSSQSTMLLDRVVAVVDDDIILQSELLNRTAQIRIQMAKRNTPLPEDEKLMEQVLDRMVVEGIELQMAEKAGIKVDDNSINDTISNIARQNQLTLDQFQQAIEQEEGMGFKSFREQIRREMTVSQLRQRRVGNRVKITDQDVSGFLNSELGKTNLAPDYHLGHILIAVDESSDENARSVAKATADEVYRKLIGGADFAAMAVSYSGDDKALEGGDLGWRKAGQLPTLFADVVVDMQKDGISEPIKSPSGYHIIKILDMRGGSEHLVAQSQVRHILIKPNEIRSEADAKTLIEDIHNRLTTKHEDFASLAKTYSDDSGSALQGGTLGWVNPGTMVAEFEKVMNAQAPHTISPVFRSQFGWHILEVTDKRNQDMSTEFKRNRAKQMLYKRKFDEDLATWLREIRQDAYVEIKL